MIRAWLRRLRAREIIRKGERAAADARRARLERLRQSLQPLNDWDVDRPMPRDRRR